ncbi:hypothetical protein [Methanomassiliicoccus luminyensis]|jgi:Na+-translocating ferredoxin:NAD+ oxidoreductase RnfD subunit|uniref:hypothetical protein n=1 Tax=Methanomassiliicoccus luminyensis TaxID=1080712 RepID=UPI000369BD15|nr:hypothetical protein [Methanomassiliicoccus luminyensis]
MDFSSFGDLISELFKPLGLWGALICIFILFYVDSILFPTLPELFTVIIFNSGIQTGADQFLFGVGMLATIVIAEVLGVLTLYSVVKFVRLSGRIERAVRKFRDFLVVPDERMILVNRVAPILPFLGAFVALCGWNLRKSLTYVMIGGSCKYGVILVLSGLFFIYLSNDIAWLVTLTMIVAVIALSMVATYIRKKRMDNAYRPA